MNHNLNMEFDGNLNNIPYKLFNLFRDEWDEYRLSQKGIYHISSWVTFIESKDLGLICIKPSESPSLDKYEVSDEKKWAIAKIKYGL